MAKYNFDEPIDRRNSFSYKWDLIKDPKVLPLWVADMDFKAAPAIYEAVNQAAAHGVYGYAMENDDYYNAIIGYHKRHYGVNIEKGDIISGPSIIAIITATLQALTRPGDQVIIQTPAYNCFFSCIRNAGCEMIANDLIYKDGKFSIDFEKLEQQAKSDRARVLLLCNPHNPTGRLWTKEELLKIKAIADKYQLIVISDEVHCDIRPNGSVFTSYLSLDESNNRLVSLHSGSKTYNIAGLKNSYAITKNKEFLNRLDRQFNINELVDQNVFGIAATIAAYTKCDDYLIELNDYIQNNFRILKEFFNKNYPKVKVTELESTYLAWVDCSSFGLDSKQIQNKLLKEGKVYINDGLMYGSTNPSFLRFNLACTKATLEEALKRFKEVF